MQRLVQLALFFGLILALSCTGDSDIRRSPWWQTHKVFNLPPGRKLVNVSWMDGTPWVLTRSVAPGEKTGEEWAFDELSNWGALNVKILIRESTR